MCTCCASGVQGSQRINGETEKPRIGPLWWKRLVACAKPSVSLAERLVEKGEEGYGCGRYRAEEQVPRCRDEIKEAGRNNKGRQQVDDAALFWSKRIHRVVRLVCKIDLSIVKAYHVSHLAEPALEGTCGIAGPGF